MAISYIKKAIRSPQTSGEETARTVSDMLAVLEQAGEGAVREYCRTLDHWDGDIVVGRERIDQAARDLPEMVKDDIRFAHARVSDFARHQRDALLEFEVELIDGLVAGQKLIPVKTAGCYVPGGRYAHVASAIMSVATARLEACVLRPQLREIADRGERWNALYAALEKRLNRIDNVSVPARRPEEEFVASSIQFHITGLEPRQLEAFADRCTARGVAIKWFGREEPMGYTSQYHHWHYLEPQQLPGTIDVLKTTFDMRIPLALTEEDCHTIAVIIGEELDKL